MRWVAAVVAAVTLGAVASPCGADDVKPVSPAQTLPFAEGQVRSSPDDDSPKRVHTIRILPAGQSQKVAPKPPVTIPIGQTTAPSPSQKAVLVEEDQANPNGRSSAGSVVWRTERGASAPGQTPDVVIRADIEIPGQKILVRLSLRRNDDKVLPASHTVEVKFTLPPDFSHGGIAGVPGLLMKVGETMRGVPLRGIALKAGGNTFLIGLSSVAPDQQRNVELMKERAWIDIPIVYSDSKRVIIALEKGTSGKRVFADAFDVWSKPEPERYASLPSSTQPDDPAAPKPSHPIVIAGDNGGELGSYIAKYHALIAAGATFRIDGWCASACTVVLAYADRVCVTRRAALGFHAARDKSGPRSQPGTDYLMSIYPAPVREYISAHGGLPEPKGMLWVTGPALRGLVKPCELR